MKTNSFEKKSELEVILEMNKNNTLIKHLTKEDGTIDLLNAYFVDLDGEIGNIPIQINLEDISIFVTQFEKAYVVFKDSEEHNLFEVAEGVINYVTNTLDIKRSDVRSILYSAGMKNIQ